MVFEQAPSTARTTLRPPPDYIHHQPRRGRGFLVRESAWSPASLPTWTGWPTIPSMTIATWITMLGVMAYVWGGCFVAVRTAMRKEAEKG